MAIDGREVLVDQARGQFRMMTGRELPLDLARRAAGLADVSWRLWREGLRRPAHRRRRPAVRERPAPPRAPRSGWWRGCEEAGYAEVILPILDYLEPYESLLTPATRGELYRFVDRDGELLALRADFTPMLARLLAPRLDSLELPLRLYYRGDVVRYQEERAGPGAGALPARRRAAGAGRASAAEREVLRLFLELATAVAAAAGCRWCWASPARSTGCCSAADADDPAPAGGGGGAARARRGAAGLPELLAWWRTACPDRPEDLGPEAAGRLRESLRPARRARRASSPASQLAIDLAEFALQQPGPAAHGGRGGPPLLRRPGLPRLRRSARPCRWAAAGATTACSAPSAPRCRRWASRSAWSDCWRRRRERP